MDLEEFEAATETDLRRKANALFLEAEKVGEAVRTALLTEARFYLDEIDRRDDAFRSRRDLWLELAIISLIVIEIVFSWVALREGKHQTDALNTTASALKDVAKNLANVQKSSDATANILAALQKITETMNGAIQNQLALNYNVFVNIVFDKEKRQLTLINTGRTNVFVWGNRVGDSDPTFDKEGHSLVPGSSYSPIMGNIGSVISSLTPLRHVPVRKPVPLEIFLKNEKNEEFVEHAYLHGGWDADPQTNMGFLRMWVELGSVQHKKWSRQKK